MHTTTPRCSPGLAILAVVLIGLFLNPPRAMSYLGSQHIDSLYSDADFVGYVEIVASEFRQRVTGKRFEGAIVTKGRINQVLRGDSTEFIYFGRFSGSAVGKTYLLFLKRSGKTVEARLRRLRDQGNPRFDTVTSPYYLIMFEGFGSMETGHSFSLELRGKSSSERWESGLGVKFETRYVILPDSLRAASITTADDSLYGRKWVARRELTNYLLQLRSRIPATGNRPLPEKWRRSCFFMHDLEHGHIADSATATSIDTELRPQFRLLFGEAFEQRLEQTKVATFDSSIVRKYREG